MSASNYFVSLDPDSDGVVGGSQHSLFGPADDGHPRPLARNAAGGSPTADIEITAAQKMLAACSGSLLTSLLVTPLDVVRVRLQSQQPSSTPALPASLSANSPLHAHKAPLSALRFHAGASPSLGVTACCREIFYIATPSPSAACLTLSPSTSIAESCILEESSRRRISGTWEGLIKIARYEGVPTLWRGLTPTLVMAVPSNVIYFTGYDSLRTSPWSPFSGSGNAWAPLLAGSAARTIAATAISPLELFRTRLQASTAPSFRDTLAGVRAMVAAGGVATLWRGLGLTLWRDVPFSGIYWLGYESVREALQKRRERLHGRVSADLHSESTFADAFASGAASGAVAALLTTPFDVGKTRMQVGNGDVGNMARVLWGIWKSEGASGLMRGCVPRMLKVAPACAIMISSYEVGKKAARNINQSRDMQ